MNAEADLVLQTISSWRAGRPPDAAGFLSAHPSVGEQKSLVLDLAYEEFCLRAGAGEDLTPSTFCSRFPAYRHSLARLLEVHAYLASNPEVARLPEAIQWPAIGDRFRGFVLLDELGRGAFSRVYLATETDLGDRQVALKVTWSGVSEARTLGKLSHENVVPVHSVQHDPDTGLTLVCMPYLGTATLHDLLEAIESQDAFPRTADIIRATAAALGREKQNGHAPSSDDRAVRGRPYADAIVDLGAQLADALAYLHERGIVHCDLKPSNVLLTTSGVPMLLDFNLASDNAALRSRVGGTLPYMASEQIKAVFFKDETPPTVVDQRSDLFSLGAMLYQLLTGELPFSGDDDQTADRPTAGMLLDRQMAKAKPIYTLNRLVDPQLDEVIRKCLEPDPESRPNSARELADRLRYLTSTKYRARRWMRKRRRPITAIMAVLAVILIMGITWIATRPSFEVRAYKSGLSHYERGEYQAAIDEFDAAVSRGYPSAQVLFGRGMAHVRIGDVESAIADFRAARKVSENGAIDAMLAYCHLLSGYEREAVYDSEQATKFGFVNAPLMNNLGLCYFRSNLQPEAEHALQRALELSKPTSVTLHNLALLHFQQALVGKIPLSKAASEIEQALAIDSKDCILFYDAAAIFATSAKENPEHKARALDYLEHAVELGANLEQVANSSMFAALRGEPRFEAAKKNSLKNPPTTRLPLVLLPVSSAVSASTP